MNTETLISVIVINVIVTIVLGFIAYLICKHIYAKKMESVNAFIHDVLYRIHHLETSFYLMKEPSLSDKDQFLWDVALYCVEKGKIGKEKIMSHFGFDGTRTDKIIAQLVGLDIVNDTGMSIEPRIHYVQLLTLARYGLLY